MRVDQIYTGCLAQGAYYIEDKGEAAIIDPLRETKPYLERLEKEGINLKYIFETHFHADFVSGHIDLAKATGATIVFGPSAKTGYDIHEAKDGELFQIGDLEMEVLHTPGHTLESSSFLLRDNAGINKAIFSGDTLFIGDVGRPDLAVKSDLSKEDLAGLLYDSLRNKIMPLSDDLIVYPGHGAGSACGKNMSNETTDTLGSQKKTNYALRGNMTKKEFVKEVIEGILPPPQYFLKNVSLNMEGYGSIDKVLEKGTVPLDVETFESMANHEGALVIDTRSQHLFAKGHIPNSMFIGLDGSFASWVGTLVIDIQQPLIFVTEAGMEEEVVTRLARVGYDNSLGFLEGGIEAWVKAGKDVESITSIDAGKLEEIIQADKNLRVLDVRRPDEYEKGHVENAQNLPLDFVNEHMSELQKGDTYYVHCVTGYRSMIMASILKPRGFQDIINVDDGLNSIKRTGIKLVKSVSESI